MRKIFISITTLALFASQVCAQTSEPCKTNHMVSKAIMNDPSLQVYLEDIDTWTEENAENLESRGSVKIIPVVFHIIHNYGPENIDDSRILTAMNLLNEDFMGTSPDLVDVVPGFTSIVNNPQFEFRLAHLDPSGNCTNGITRTQSTLTYDAEDNVKIISWPRNKYYNIWVCYNIYSDTPGAVTAGYSYFPGTAPSASVDGSLLAYSYVGNPISAFNKRVLSHETGHWFRLAHPWGNGAIGTCGDDFVGDTPETDGSFSTCNLSKITCNSGVLENVQNIMDYSSCTNMFTNNQSTRMINAANSTTGQRNNLSLSSNLTATGTNNPYTQWNECSPVVDFYANRYSVCTGSNISFIDNTSNASVTSRLWTVTNGVVTLTDTAANQNFVFTQPGLYNVTLDVISPAGSGTLTKTAFVYVYDAVADYSTYIYTDPFEDGPITNNKWFAQNIIPTSNGWRETNAVYVSNSTSLMVRNYGSPAGRIYNLISPSYDFTTLPSGVSVSFKVAFAKRNSASNDQLKLFVSTNCGQTWLARDTWTVDELTSTTDKPAEWYPTASQWKTLTNTNYSVYATRTNVRFKLEFTSSNGNNIFIDDWNISGTVGLEDNLSENMFVFPNPVKDAINVQFNSPNDEVYTVNLIDVQGRVVQVWSDQVVVTGKNNISLPISSSIQSGVYALQIINDRGQATQKIIIE